MYGVADGGWCGDEVFKHGRCMNGKMEGEVWESYELSPHLKFGRLIGW